jgi:tetratricopeptide (TPR) repeat protein
MADSPRIQELRRRIQQDPASLSFAPLAEELRRAGRIQDAIDTCRAGLAIHPAYVSARATLGRALLDQGALDEALTELTTVLAVAPENLAALKGVAEIRERLAAGKAPPVEAAPAPPPPESQNAVIVRRLERFLDAILADRARH